MPEPRPVAVAVVIVSYNGRDDLARCLAAVRDQAGDPAIVVVDNGSTDGTPDLVRRAFPTVILIEPGKNLGFARANNVGIRATTSPLVLVLNPDTVMPPGALGALVSHLEAHPEAAVVAPRLVDQGGRVELSFGWAMGPLGELQQKLASALLASGLPGLSTRIQRWTRQPGEREWVSGACLLARRADLEAVGLFDERYFLYTEDVDLCVAIRSRGRAVRFCPEVEVVHLRGRSAGTNPETERLRRASQLAYYAKHHPRWVPWLRGYLRLTGRPVPRG